MNENEKKYRMDYETYVRMYEESIRDRETFWSNQAREMLSWSREWDTVLAEDEGAGTMRWFDGAHLNASYNCIDRHVESGHGEQVAFHFEENGGGSRTITYRELLGEVSRLANALKARGVGKGDRVCIYMPMIPEAAYAMLACARIGAVHTVVFGGFSSSALLSRINDAACVAIITAEVVRRGDKVISLKEQADKIMNDCPSVRVRFIVQNSDTPSPLGPIDVEYRAATAAESDVCEPEQMEAEDPLFILYTSGSTGKPKGVLHTTGGYLLYAATTFKYVFDYRDSDVYWCAADIGWITGHSYLVYGPLANRATSVLFEGIVTYPDASRPWQIVDKYGVSVLYTAPTLIRMLMGQGYEYLEQSSRQSLRILGSVGEPINPEAWQWYHDTVGEGRCAVVDTWWQTETGGQAIAPIPGVVTPKPGAAMLPLFSITPVIVDDKGNELSGEAEGSLLLKGVWPGRMRDLFGDHERFLDIYFRQYPGYYFTGDGARRDKDGHYWITGRIDDVMKISGHLIGTAEVESALILHPLVSEAAVIAIPHDVRGGSMCAYVCLNAGAESSPETERELIGLVREHVGAFAKPEKVFIIKALPKTRSGKIMRRILRKIATGETGDIGDTSTLADPEVVNDIIAVVKGRAAENAA